MDAHLDTIGGVSVVDAALDGSTTVLVGCDLDGTAPFPIWWADADFVFRRAVGPDGLGCIRQVEVTPFGWFAAGTATLWSVDGRNWERLDLSPDLGLEYAGQLGYAQAIFASPAEQRVTLLYSRAAEAESTIATLVTTEDGVDWSAGPADSATLFDSSTIAAVTPGGDGLLAGGSSPGGEFVPTAAVFTSPDGLEWRRVTPTGDTDFDDKVINDLINVEDRYYAVGGDFFRTGLMAAWSSEDGRSWERLPHPNETTDPAVAFMTAEAVTVAHGHLWVSGRDSDARRDEPQAIPALWRTTDGHAWERVDVADLERTVPFELSSRPGLRIGVWPPPYSLIDEPTALFVSD